MIYCLKKIIIKILNEGILKGIKVKEVYMKVRKSNLNNLYSNQAYKNAVNSSKSSTSSFNANLVGFYIGAIKLVCIWCLIQIVIEQL